MGLTKVSTDGVKDDAITSGKIPANAVGASELADNAVDTNAIANNAVTAGKTSGVQTTINNNADNRLITGSGSANTLNGETNATFTGTKLNLGAYDGGTDVNLSLRNTNSGGYGAYISGGSGTNYILRLDDKDQNAMFRFNANGNFGIGTGSPSKKLHVFESGESRIRIETGDSRGQAFDLLSTNGAGTNTGTLSIRNESNQSFIDFSHNGGSPFTKIYNTGSQQFTFDSDGLKFGTDTAAANALDDYEEGTWTPDLRVASYLNNANSFTYTSRTGIYTKIGNKVFINAFWQVSNYHSYTGNLYLFGLPYAPAQLASNINPVLTIVGDGANKSNNDMMFALIEGGNNRAVLGHQGGSGWSHLVVSEVDQYGMYLSGNYEVN